jgi:hypothetical protein
MIKAKNKKKTEKPFRSMHGLDFEDGGPFRFDDSFRYFRIGTVEGLYGVRNDAYLVLAIINKEPGNGFMIDFYQYFERSCRRDKKAFRIIEIINSRFMAHLIDKQGFKRIGVDTVEKKFERVP